MERSWWKQAQCDKSKHWDGLRASGTKSELVFGHISAYLGKYSKNIKEHITCGTHQCLLLNEVFKDTNLDVFTQKESRILTHSIWAGIKNELAAYISSHSVHRKVASNQAFFQSYFLNQYTFYDTFKLPMTPIF